MTDSLESISQRGDSDFESPESTHETGHAADNLARIQELETQATYSQDS